MTATASIVAALVVTALPTPGVAQQPADAERLARRVIATTSLAALEYGEGVVDGRIVLAAEVQEATEFLWQAEEDATRLPPHATALVGHLIDSMATIVAAVGSPQLVGELAARVADGLDEAFGGLPQLAPSLRFARGTGERIYKNECAECHGDAGRGDGIKAATLDPRPSDLTDRVELADRTPLEFFRKISVGVAGTAMPAMDETLTVEERWAVAWYATNLRGRDLAADGETLFNRFCDGCPADDDPSDPMLSHMAAVLADPETLAGASDEQIAEALAAGAIPGTRRPDNTEADAIVAYLRTLPFAEADAVGDARTFARVRTELARAVRDARNGDGEAATGRFVDAYVAFEAVETDVAVRDQALVAAIEADFVELKGRVGSPAALQPHYARLLGELEEAESVLQTETSTAGLFIQSFVLLLREGLEAILIVGVLTTVVARTGASEKRRHIWWGIGLAIVASVLTAVLIETVFRLGIAEQEALEGITMLVASGVLIFVGHWLIARVEVTRWKAFVASHAAKATSTGSLLAMGTAAFLAVYREGFETVLFYKALIISADGGGTGAIGLGALVAGAVLLAVYVGIERYGVKIPLRPFFAVTSAALLYLAFTFAGQGVMELQESDLIRTTIIESWPRLPWLGLYPTMQAIALQGVIALLIVAGLVWTFVVQPRRVVLERG